MNDDAIAAALPDNILFGTSSWNYPGWRGSVYQKDYSSDKAFKETALEEYSQHPLFRTVGVDSFFYGPPRETTLLKYAALVPPNFKWVSKVWEEITIPRYSRHPRYGSKAGTLNKNFLNPDIFKDSILNVIEKTKTTKHFGPFVFQFQKMDIRPAARANFFQKLNSFLSELPKSYSYAVEVRNAELLSNEYFQVLNENGATHCFNHWSEMPPLIEQMKASASAGGLEAPFFVSRILTPLGVSYSEAVDRFSPYDSIKQRNPQMRADVVRLVKRALSRNSQAFIIVNNRSEGNSPQTIREISSMIVG
jgi:uncharacterized protein YecE (DUF72 family)